MKVVNLESVCRIKYAITAESSENAIYTDSNEGIYNKVGQAFQNSGIVSRDEGLQYLTSSVR